MKKIIGILLISIIVLGCSKDDTTQKFDTDTVQEQVKGFIYQDFKKAFQIGALQCEVPFSLADSLIQEGAKAASMQVFFTDNSYMILYMTPKTHIIKEVNVSIAPSDKNYAYAILWALENLNSVDRCKSFFDKIMSKKVGEKLESNSGFKYSHPEPTKTIIAFNAIEADLE